MTDNEFFDAMKKFSEAQMEAEKAGKKDFVCPLCGGKAWWGRSDINNHLHCGCYDCKYLVMQ